MFLVESPPVRPQVALSPLKDDWRRGRAAVVEERSPLVRFRRAERDEIGPVAALEVVVELAALNEAAVVGRLSRSRRPVGGRRPVGARPARPVAVRRHRRHCRRHAERCNRH